MIQNNYNSIKIKNVYGRGLSACNSTHDVEIVQKQQDGQQIVDNLSCKH